MTLRLNGSTSGFVELKAPAAAANNTLTLPSGNGAAGDVLQGDGSGTLTFGKIATANVSNGAITPAKLSTGGPSAPTLEPM